ncbi:MAG TPA: hypothetical protein PKW55_04190 [Spirochaetota bacterium]|nr:hypothetical protein [Spirochaetota bacterium]HOM37963.1 hypothetical protein [Spirochaetota bacterium]
MIFIFILSLNSFAEQGYFKEFNLGESFDNIKNKLLLYKIIIDKESVTSFKMDVPLFLYLKMVIENNDAIYIDPDEKRIYLDDSTFFDFQDIIIDEKDYSFYSKDNLFYINFKSVQSYSISEPKRINPVLRDLKLKFFKNFLYCIEYKAELENYEINRVINNYKIKYGVTIDKPINKFETDTTIFFVELSEKKIKIILTDKKILSQIESTINDITKKVIVQITKIIEKYLEKSINIDKLWLQYKKNILKKSLEVLYSNIDEL